MTMIDGAETSGDGSGSDRPGVLMAEDAALDGFTITNMGLFDEALWQMHFESHGETLGDEEGSVQAEGTTPAISIQGVSCTVINCIVHHNGDVGIGILGKVDTRTEPLVTNNLVYRNMGGGIGVAEGAQPIIRGNICKENLRAGIGCRNASPIIIGNTCFLNIRAGIGCREGARPVLRGNKCCRNRRAGIGIRMQGTAPLVEDNECCENALAGIGCRDGADPILRNNVCRRNGMAGIGIQGKASAVVQQNMCVDNQLVAVGVTEESSATIIDNELSRTDGVPPIIAVKDGSTVTIRNNRITGAGVAAILVQGQATVSGNSFVGIGEKQGTAVWVHENSVAMISDNTFKGYRTAVNSTKASVIINGNSIWGFDGTAIRVKESRQPAHIYGNRAFSVDTEAKVVEVSEPSGIVQENTLRIE